MDLSTSLINIYGPGESGKSNFAKWLLSRPAYSRHVVFDPMHEFDPERYNVYRPDHLDYEKGNEELNEFLKVMLDLDRGSRPRYIYVDEAANYIPGGNKPVGRYVNRVAQHNTHIHPGITFITSNRHITDLNKTLREMYQHMFVFGLRGDSSKRAAKGLASGLVDVVEQLNQYEFVHVSPGGEFTVFSPVDDMGDYDRI